MVTPGILQITERDGSVVFRVRVQPGASRNEIVGELDGMLKLRIAAPPVNGRANQECRRFLAALLKVAPGMVDLKGGASSRTKTIMVRNITAEYARKHFEVALRVAAGGAELS